MRQIPRYSILAAAVVKVTDDSITVVVLVVMVAVMVVVMVLVLVMLAVI